MNDRVNERLNRDNYCLIASIIACASNLREQIMKQGSKIAMAAGATLIGSWASSADTLQTHRIPAVLALEAVGEAVATCAQQGYRETVTVLDTDGATIATLRGDGAGIHTLDSAHDKAYTSVSFKNDTLALAERAKGEDSIAPLAKLPHVMFFGGGIVIKLNDEIIGSIGAAGAPGAKLDDICARAGLEKIRDRLK
ncbi:MAG: heme-binding protein [Pseudolabrys sp.]